MKILFKRYVDYISTKATEVCTSYGKKTLNIDHILEALKLINFNSHIKKLQGELDFDKIINEKDDNLSNKKESQNLIYEDSIGMKDLINKKRKNKKDKKAFQYSEDMLNEQMELFEKSKMENMQNILMKGGCTTLALNEEEDNYTLNTNIKNCKEGNFNIKNGQNKKLNLDIIEKNLFANEKKEYQEEVDFD